MRLLSLLFLTFIFLSPLPSAAYKTGNESQPTPTEKGKEASQQITKGLCENNASSIAEDHKPQSHDWVDKLNASSTAIIALFTILLFFGIFYQVSNTRDVERSWMVIEELVQPPELKQYTLSSPTALKAKYQVRNCGRTPGRIIKSHSWFGIVKSQ